MAKRYYLIWSDEHKAWWKPNKAGYTYYMREAGRYTERQATNICEQAMVGWCGVGHPPETMFPVKE